MYDFCKSEYYVVSIKWNTSFPKKKKKIKGILHLFFSEKQWVTFIEKLRLRLNKQGFKILKGSFTIYFKYIL